MRKRIEYITAATVDHPGQASGRKRTDEKNGVREWVVEAISMGTKAAGRENRRIWTEIV
jgi:hypothetical protein